jgi:hypothetical protein
MTKLRIIGAASLLALAACGSTPQAAGQVATLTSAAPVTSSAAPVAPAAAGRPQLRVDTSDEEAEKLQRAYEDCLLSHGAKKTTARVSTGRVDMSGEPKAAYAACAKKQPLQPPELDEDQNPNFAAQWNDNVKCLRAHGLMVHVTEPGSWTYDTSDTAIPENSAELEKSCLLEAFGG